MIRKLSIFGSPFIGVYVVVNNEIAISPDGISETVKDIIEKTLNVDVFTTSIDGSPLLGTLMVMNSRGAVITDFADEKDVKFLFDKMNVLFIEDKINAVGNDILVNDKAAMVHIEYSSSTIKLIEDALDVEVVKGTIGGVKTVGSAAIVTNKGMLVHPETGEEEVEYLKNLFGVPVHVTTANYGSIYLGASMVANWKGAIVGDKTSNVEIDRIENGLDII